MRIDFYHLEKMSLEKVLPAILLKAYSSGNRVLIKTDLAEQADVLNTFLWTYDPASFLPHACEKDGFSDKQPIFITHKEHFNPNNATICVLTNDVPVCLDENFARILYFFNGLNEESLKKAREQWKKVSEAGAEKFYWKQNGSGKWENKG